MKKVVVNIILSILSMICIIFIILSFTICNSNYVIHEMEKHDYYQDVYDNVVKDMKEFDGKLVFSLSMDDLRKDLNGYVKNKMNVSYTINSKIKCNDNNDDIDKIYINNIRFKNLFYNIDLPMIRMLIYIVTIVLIFITGNIFLKTKKIHDIDLICFSIFILSIIIYGALYLTINIEYKFLGILFNNFIHSILSIGIILFEYFIFIKLKRTIKK